MSGTLTFEPEALTWPDLLRSATQRSGDNQHWRGRSWQEWRILTRSELGLPSTDDRRDLILATGHQPGLWHPGILIKFMAVDQLRRELLQHGHGVDSVTCLHLVVDQDTTDPSSMDLPLRLATGEVTVTTVHHGRVQSPSTPASTHVTGMQPPVRGVGPTTPEEMDPAVRPGALAAIHDALQKHEAAPSLAMQYAQAAGELMRPWVDAMQIVTATGLMDTTLAKAMVACMREALPACIEAYNRAVALTPEAGLLPLERNELPLWRITPKGVRRAVMINELDDVESQGETLAPRALLMTAIMRLGVSDVFVHGRGGWVYDRVMERWIEDWLSATPMPMTMATADLYLPFDDLPAPGDAGEPCSVETALAHLRRQLHDPSANGSGISGAKQDWLARIEAQPRGSRERREVFFAYHNWLRKARETHRDALEAAQRSLEAARRWERSRAHVTRRTWAFPLYPVTAIDTLRVAVTDQFHRHEVPAAG